MQIMNLLVLSRRHPFCCVNSSIKTRDTYLPPIPSLTPITQASAASIQKPIRPLGYIVCQTLVTVADLPIPASPQLLCPSVLGDASEGTRSGMSARGWICTEAREHLLEIRALASHRRGGGITRRLNGCTHGGRLWRSRHVFSSLPFLPTYSPCRLARCPQYQIRLFRWSCSSFAVLCGMRGSRSIGTTVQRIPKLQS